MAVGVAEAQAQIIKKISLSNTEYMYIGTLAFGTEYATSGDTLGTAEGSRHKLPAQIDFMTITQMSGYSAEYVKSSGKVMVRWPGKEKEAAIEVAAKTNLSAVTVAQFIAIGC